MNPKVKGALLISSAIIAFILVYSLGFTDLPFQPDDESDETNVIRSTVDMEIAPITWEQLFNKTYLDIALEDTEQLVNSAQALPEYPELKLQYNYMLDDLDKARQACEAGLYDKALAYIKQSRSYATKIIVYVEMKDGSRSQTECRESILQRVEALEDIWWELKEKLTLFGSESYRIDDYLAWVPDLENKMLSVLSLLNQSEYAVMLFDQGPSNATDRPAITYLATGLSLTERAREYLDEVECALQSIPNKLRQRKNETYLIEQIVFEIRAEVTNLLEETEAETYNGTYAIVLLESAEGHIKKAEELLTHGFEAAALLDYINAKAILHAASAFKSTPDPWLTAIPDPPSPEEVQQSKKQAVLVIEQALEEALNFQEKGVNLRQGLKLLKDVPMHYVSEGDAFLSRHLEMKSNWQFLGTASDIMYKVAEIVSTESFSCFLDSISAETLAT